MISDEVVWDDNGLVAAIVQDAGSGRVLMLGWMNQEALAATIETERVHFWSRSRGELWEKGATSGNRLDLESVAVDCDGDALLVTARPTGPTCHTGTRTCWGDDAPVALSGLADLWEVVASRAADRPEGSYTASLVAAGPEGPGRKLVEEATEVLLAAKDHAAGTADDQRVAEEAADLVYHLLVTLAERSIHPALVLEELATRRR